MPAVQGLYLAFQAIDASSILAARFLEKSLEVIQFQGFLNASQQRQFLKPGAFDGQNLVTISHAKLLRKLGELDSEQLSQVEDVLLFWLGFEDIDFNPSENSPLCHLSGPYRDPNGEWHRAPGHVDDLYFATAFCEAAFYLKLTKLNYQFERASVRGERPINKLIEDL